MMQLAFLEANGLTLLKGAGMSISIAILGCSIGISIALICVFLQSQPYSYLRWLVAAYVSLIRGTPMLIQILFLFFVLPGFNIQIPPYWTAIIAIGLNSGAYVTNIIRAGILSVGKGQSEAARVLGLSQWQTFRLIVIPQALRLSLPTLGNEFISLVKDSSLASIIGVFELSKQGELIVNRTYDALQGYTWVAIFYLCMTLSLSFIIHLIEKKANKHVSS